MYLKKRKYILEGKCRYIYSTDVQIMILQEIFFLVIYEYCEYGEINRAEYLVH